VIGYQRGATMTYSLSAFSPWEGYRVAFNETGGRIELDVVERSWVPPPALGEQDARVIDPSADRTTSSGPGGSRPSGERITLQRLWEPAVQIPIPAGARAHGGGDDLLLRDLFHGAAWRKADRSSSQSSRSANLPRSRGSRTRQATAGVSAGLPLLLGGADQHLIDSDMPRPGNDVGDRIGDVLGLHPLAELVSDALEHLRPVMAGQLRRRRAGLY
jgi:hypothetical protein